VFSMTPRPQLKIRKDCSHFEVCSILGRGCSNWITDPCAYFAYSTHKPSERDEVLDELVSMLIESCSENYEPNGMGCKCCPFLIVYDDGLQCAIKKLRQRAGEP
jgi:hypothetical protein